MNPFRKAWQWFVSQVYRNGEFQIIWGGGVDTYAGKTITPQSALQTVAVLRCVDLIASAGASLPIDVYEKRGGRRRKIDHPVERVLDVEPNPDMSAQDLRAFLWASMLLWGNGYAKIVRRGNRPDGEVISLWPLQPDFVAVKRDSDGRLYYEYRTSGAEVERYEAWQIFHVRGLSADGVIGLSPIALARNAIALNQATEEYGARFYRHGAGQRIAIQYPAKLSQDAIKNIRESFEQQYGSVANAHRIAVLEQGATATTLGIPPRDAQFLEQQQFSDEKIAMLFGVPPHMIGLVSKSTSWGTGIAEQKNGFATFTLLPRIGYWESAIRRSLLTEADKRRGIYVKHNLAAFLRANAKERMEAYALAVDKGLMSRDEVRALEDMDPIPDGTGRLYTVQSQYVPLSAIGGAEGGN